MDNYMDIVKYVRKDGEIDMKEAEKLHQFLDQMGFFFPLRPTEDNREDHSKYVYVEVHYRTNLCVLTCRLEEYFECMTPSEFMHKWRGKHASKKFGF